jgi:hypothetical protein
VHRRPVHRRTAHSRARAIRVGGAVAAGGDRRQPQAFYDIFDRWKAELESTHPEADDGDWSSYRSNMWDGEFVLTATRDDVAAIKVPMLLAMGNDLHHPQSTSREIAALAPDVTFVEHWKENECLPATDAAIKNFLANHTPGV